MLSQKLVTLFALVMVFASRGVIGLPYPSPEDGSLLDGLELTVGDIVGDAGAGVFPAEAVDAAVAAAEKHKA
jgi:hypothetical protein